MKISTRLDARALVLRHSRLLGGLALGETGEGSLMIVRTLAAVELLQELHSS